MVMARVPHAPPSPTKSASVSYAGTVLYFLLVSSVMVYLYNFQTLWGLFDGLMLDLPLFFMIGCALLLREA
jgi:hypothetical protein